YAVVRPRARPLRRGLAEWQTRGRSLRRFDRRRVLRRIDVSSCPRRFEDRAGGPDGTVARSPLHPARYAMAHAAPAKIRRDRDLASAISASALHLRESDTKFCRLAFCHPERSRETPLLLQSPLARCR